MSPIDSDSQDFHVFKRRKKTNPKGNNIIDVKNVKQTTIQEESSKDKKSQEQTTIVLTSLPTPFSNVEAL